MLLALAIRLPLATTATYLSLDAVEYLDIARHLAAGKGYTLSVKGYYVDDSPVVHNGLTERPPLFPLMLTPLAALPGWPRSAGLLNVALGTINVGLVYALSRGFSWRAVSLAAALVAALAVPMVELSVRPMAEQLSLCLLLLGFPGAVSERRVFLLASGSVLGLAYLARPASIVFLPALAYAASLAAADTRPPRRALLPCIGFALESRRSGPGLSTADSSTARRVSCIACRTSASSNAEDSGQISRWGPSSSFGHAPAS